MADPTPAEVHAALAILAAAEAAREAHVEPVAAPAVVAVVPAPTATITPASPVVVEMPAAVDPYLSRSVKSSPNGF